LTIYGTAASVVSAGGEYEFQPQATAVGPLIPYFEVQNLPGRAAFDSYNGHISGSPTPSDVGTYQGIQVSITDGESTVTLPAFAIVVQDMDGSQSEVLTLTWLPPTGHYFAVSALNTSHGESDKSPVLAATVL
jgi:hypothetical protein